MIEIDGKRFLTDPMWSKRATPVRPFGPVRFFDAPLMLEQIPEIDGVIISHDHFDHLDCATIIKLGKTGVMFYVPLGVGHLLESWGISKFPLERIIHSSLRRHGIFPAGAYSTGTAPYGAHG
ncbi:MAG: MBL fold metallo-hydrolase [Deltaproteobacteria bacterium]|nr:MBL fold metallo-hydrolase [Deltaproteobacteria bacterium]